MDELPTPITRSEQYLAKIAGAEPTLPVPITREERYLAKIAGEDVDIPPEPITRTEQYLAAIAENGGGVEVEALSVTQNDTYTAPEGKAYSPVTVNVPNTYAAGDEGKVVSGGALVSQSSDTVTQNGTVDTTLISSLDVNVSGGGGGAEDGIIDRTISGAYTNPRVTIIGDYAFNRCLSLTEVNFPEALSIGAFAFGSCPNIESISFPKVKTIGSYAFISNTNITALPSTCFPEVTYIANSAFDKCKMSYASFPKATIISNMAFYSCTNLEAVSFPEATTIYNGAFSDCNKLSEVYFPKVQEVWSSAFMKCSSLTTASFPACTSIGTSTFRSCIRLISLYLLGSVVPSLGSGVFYNTPIGGYSTTAGQLGNIYVPASLYSSYMTAPYWSAVSSRFVSV